MIKSLVLKLSKYNENIYEEIILNESLNLLK